MQDYSKKKYSTYNFTTTHKNLNAILCTLKLPNKQTHNIALSKSPVYLTPLQIAKKLYMQSKTKPLSQNYLTTKSNRYISVACAQVNKNSILLCNLKSIITGLQTFYCGGLILMFRAFPTNAIVFVVYEHMIKLIASIQ